MKPLLCEAPIMPRGASLSGSGCIFFQSGVQGENSDRKMTRPESRLLITDITYTHLITVDNNNRLYTTDNCSCSVDKSHHLYTSDHFNLVQFDLRMQTKDSLN